MDAAEDSTVGITMGVVAMVAVAVAAVVVVAAAAAAASVDGADDDGGEGVNVAGCWLSSDNSEVQMSDDGRRCVAAA